MFEVYEIVYHHKEKRSFQQGFLEYYQNPLSFFNILNKVIETRQIRFNYIVFPYLNKKEAFTKRFNFYLIQNHGKSPTEFIGGSVQNRLEYLIEQGNDILEANYGFQLKRKSGVISEEYKNEPQKNRIYPLIQNKSLKNQKLIYQDLYTFIQNGRMDKIKYFIKTLFYGAILILGSQYLYKFCINTVMDGHLVVKYLLSPTQNTLMTLCKKNQPLYSITHSNKNKDKSKCRVQFKSFSEIRIIDEEGNVQHQQKTYTQNPNCKAIYQKVQNINQNTHQNIF